MKFLTFLFIAPFILVSSCQKDGTEKRCEKGFTGKNCDQEITPSKIQVTYIEANKLPVFDENGYNWDPLGGKPDVYFRILEQSSGTTVYTSGIAADANHTLNVWTDVSGNSVLINSPAMNYIIQAWDHDDLDADDFMGGIIFQPYVKGERFPSPVNLECSGCNTAWIMKFTYLF